MSIKPLHRTLSLAFAALLTTAMLTGIDQLAQHEDRAPLWAQQTTVRA